MNAIETYLAKRKIPQIPMRNGLPDRAAMIAVLEDEVYGHAPEAPERVTAEIVSRDEHACADKCVTTELKLSFATERGTFSFPVTETVPKGDGRKPTFVSLDFYQPTPNKYYPTEEIADDGIAVCKVCYQDLTADNGDFSSGIAAEYDREKYDWGKLRMWAFCASRVLDYVLTTDYADYDRVGVVGHSRLGKTALLAAAADERFAIACANESGCSGDAITRGKAGERVRQITGYFPFWFNKVYPQFADHEENMRGDQHFLLASIAPRAVSLGGATGDEWADPVSQYLSACAANIAWQAYGKNGMIHPDRLPIAGDDFPGELSYHLRAGTHYFSRADWRVYCDALKRAKGDL